MLAQDEGVPLLQVFFLLRVQVDEVLQVVAVLEQQPGVVDVVVGDDGAGLELDFAEGVEEGLFGFGDEDLFAGALGGGFLGRGLVGVVGDGYDESGGVILRSGRLSAPSPQRLRGRCRGRGGT